LWALCQELVLSTTQRLVAALAGQGAFEGKLVPQDPTDEPAGELLARIKAEREQSGSAKRRKEGPAWEEPAETQASLF
jgi:hypothetical protein